MLRLKIYTSNNNFRLKKTTFSWYLLKMCMFTDDPITETGKHYQILFKSIKSGGKKVMVML